MAMNFDEAKAYVLTQEPTFLRRARNINGRHSFVCPCCDNGAGKDGTGITANPYSNPEHPYYKCFKCGEGGDVITLAKAHTGYGFRRAVEFLCDEYGVDLEGYEGSANKRPELLDNRSLRASEQRPPMVSQAEYFKRVERNLDPEYLLHRGISLATQRHYHVGTDYEWVNPVVAEKYKGVDGTPGNIPPYLKSPRCIIPTSEYSYLARDIREDVDERAKKYQKVKFGQVRLFAKEEAFAEKVFVVTEGEIDAMSVYEATGGNLKATGLGSTANWRILVREMEERGVKPDMVLLALDNDEAGEKARSLLEESFSSMGIETKVLFYCGKDPNEALKNDKESFSLAISDAIGEWMEEEVFCNEEVDR